MFKNFIFSCFTLTSIYLPAQSSDTSLVFYEKGVDAFSAKAYRLADSLFTVSIKLHPHPDTYYNRATNSLILNNKKGYCQDLGYAGGMHDREAHEEFRKRCGSADTTFTDQTNAPATRAHHAFYSVNYSMKNSDSSICAKYDHSNKLIGFNKVANVLPDSIVAAPKSLPQFPGGNQSMNDFISKTLQVPKEAKDKNLSGDMLVRVVVNTWGYLENIEVLEGLGACMSCDKEVVRVISNMPQWISAKVKGKPVKSNYAIPVTFK